MTVREGRFGPYVDSGRVNATIPKSTRPDSITLADAVELIAEREGKPAPAARKAPAKGAPAKAKAVPAKKPAARTAAKAKPRAAARKR